MWVVIVITFLIVFGCDVGNYSYKDVGGCNDYVDISNCCSVDTGGWL